MKRKHKIVQKKIETKINLLALKTYRNILRPFSRFFRRVFETSGIQKTIGTIVISSIFSVAILPASISQVQTSLDKNYSHPSETQVETTTEKSVRLPLDSFEISQGYSFFHRGIDLASQTGNNIYPVMDGIVEKAEHDRWAYGNHVITNHGSGFRSLYAHLSQISVKEGQAVSRNDVLGFVGSTGWSTGPHLHLQIWDENGLINPRTFFESYFGQRLASTR